MCMQLGKRIERLLKEEYPTLTIVNGTLVSRFYFYS